TARLPLHGQRAARQAAITQRRRPRRDEAEPGGGCISERREERVGAAAVYLCAHLRHVFCTSPPRPNHEIDQPNCSLAPTRAGGRTRLRREGSCATPSLSSLPCLS